MHHANHWYGHAHILARYVGLAEVPRIWGYLQHGWNIHDGFAVGTAFAPGFPKYVWSPTPARIGWSLGLRNYMVIGSPWAYLLKLERQTEWEQSSPDREGTIVYPFHGWEQQKIVGSHDAFVEELKATEEGSITVCLYWNEYRDYDIRRSYERAGLRVVCHGYRGYMWRETDTDFLDKQLAELRRHRRVVSNRLSSAIFYGASVGCEVGVYGDPMILEAERVALGGMARQHRQWPDLHQPFVPQAIAQAHASKELGLDQTLSQVELAQALGWKDARKAPVDAAGRSKLNESNLSDQDLLTGRAKRRFRRTSRLNPDDAPLETPLTT